MKKIILLLIILFCGIMFVTSCDDNANDSDENGDKQNENNSEINKDEQGEKKNMKVVIELYDGRKIKIELYEDIAPITVKNFLKLVDQDYYKDVIFHRVIANFMIQTGGYKLIDNTINEAPEVSTIKGEFASNGVENNLKHTIGVVSMARTNVKDSASSQFFICTADTPHLDGEYAAFGKVIDEESMRVVLNISYVSTGNFYYFQDFPHEPIVIKTIKRLTDE